jgi:hypothetical protein
MSTQISTGTFKKCGFLTVAILQAARLFWASVIEGPLLMQFYLYDNKRIIRLTMKDIKQANMENLNTVLPTNNYASNETYKHNNARGYPKITLIVIYL